MNGIFISNLLSHIDFSQFKGIFSMITMILLISLLVLVHEFGHYIAARMFGVRVARFGIGMPIGPSWKLFTFQKTDFYIHACLFGGYVSFIDDLESEQNNTEKQNSNQEEKENKEEKKEEIETIPEDSPERYENKTIAQKLIIVSAGVVMNVVFAFILVFFCAIYYHKLPTPYQNLYVEKCMEKTISNIKDFDIKKGDQFSKINSLKIDSFYKLTFLTKNSKLFDDYASKELYEINLEKLKELNPNIKDEIPENTEVLLPEALPEKPLSVNDNVLVGLEKYKKDGIELTKEQIELRDEIYSKKSYIAKATTSLNDIALALSDTYKPMSIVFLRNGKEFTIDNVKVGKEGLLGVMLRFEEINAETKTFKQIIVNSYNYIYTTTKTMLFSLWQLIAGKVSAGDMHGVIAVVKVGGDIIATKGMLNGILLTAMISINLAIMNFLPIPALDGGHVFFLIIEKLTGKKPGKELGEKINNFFFILLILLMIAICYNDIFALVTKKF